MPASGRYIYIPYSVTKVNANPFSYSANVTIHCSEGSAAETFADDNDFEYVTDEFKQEVNYTVYPADTWFTASWDNVEGADSYEILIFTNKENTCIKLISGITDTAYKSEQNFLSSNSTYKFVVRPCVNGKYGAYSLTEAKVVTLYRNPGNVNAPRVNNTTDNTVELSWWTNYNATGYDVYVLDEKNAEWKLFKRVTENGCTITGLKPGTEYNFRVVPVKTVEAGDIFGIPWETSAKTTGGVAVSPVITKAVPDDSSVTITREGVNGAEKYNVFTYINGKYTSQGTTTATTFTVKKLVNGAKYGFLVRAYVGGKWTSFTVDDVIYATPSK